jgi:hypothetical protein
MDKAKIEPLPQIGGYDITRRLGRGGMADVYLATQVSLGRPVAIKVLSTERTLGEETVTRFEQEARTIARLDHPNIVSIFDVGRTDDSRLYYVMPYCRTATCRRATCAKREAEIVAIALAGARSATRTSMASCIATSNPRTCCSTLDRPLLADFGIALASSDFSARHARRLDHRVIRYT